MSSTITLNVTLNAQGFYDEIEIEDMTYNEELETYFYPCPWYLLLE